MKHLQRLIDVGTVYARSVKKRDRAVYRSEVYDIFNLVYDEDDKFIRSAYVCKICSEAVFVHQENGNQKLRRHGCFQSSKYHAKKSDKISQTSESKEESYPKSAQKRRADKSEKKQKKTKRLDHSDFVNDSFALDTDSKDRMADGTIDQALSKEKTPNIISVDDPNIISKKQKRLVSEACFTIASKCGVKIFTKEIIRSMIPATWDSW